MPVVNVATNCSVTCISVQQTAYDILRCRVCVTLLSRDWSQPVAYCLFSRNRADTIHTLSALTRTAGGLVLRFRGDKLEQRLQVITTQQNTMILNRILRRIK